MAGDAGGVLEVEAVVGDAALGSAATGALFTTSADMVPSEPRRTSRRSVVGGAGWEDNADGSSSVFQGAARSNRADDSSTPTHGFLVICLDAEKVKW